MLLRPGRAHSGKRAGDAANSGWGGCGGRWWARAKRRLTTPNYTQLRLTTAPGRKIIIAYERGKSEARNPKSEVCGVPLHARKRRRCALPGKEVRHLTPTPIPGRDGEGRTDRRDYQASFASLFRVCGDAVEVVPEGIAAAGEAVAVCVSGAAGGGSFDADGGGGGEPDPVERGNSRAGYRGSRGA